MSAVLPTVAGTDPADLVPVLRQGSQLHLLVIDNYDSFTYNLVQYLGQLGARQTVLRNDRFTLAEAAQLRPDGIVISPGPCTPAEAGQSVAAVREFGGRVPILGVCLGHQAIGAAYGASVVRAGTLMHGKTSRISHDADGLFRGLPDPLTVTRYHSLVLRDLPAELTETASVTDDGEHVNMALRHVTHHVYGVQFHPESILTEGGHRLLRNFMGICAEA